MVRPDAVRVPGLFSEQRQRLGDRQNACGLCPEVAKQSPNEPGPILPFQLMLPDAEHRPALGSEAAAYQPVPGPVSLDLASPKCSPSSRPGCVPGTAVPETAVHEHGEPLPRKNKVRFTRQLGAPSPAGDRVGQKNPDQPQLGGLVAAGTYGRHDGGAFAPGEDVGHGPAAPVRLSRPAARNPPGSRPSRETGGNRRCCG